MYLILSIALTVTSSNQIVLYDVCILIDIVPFKGSIFVYIIRIFEMTLTILIKFSMQVSVAKNGSRQISFLEKNYKNNNPISARLCN